MSLLYLDCFAGISGDMMVAALLDLGLDMAFLQQELHKLPLSGYRLHTETVSRRGVQARRFEVHLLSGGDEHLADAGFVEVDTPDAGHAHSHAAHTHAAHRGLSDILSLLEGSDLSPRVKETAARIFTRLAEAEARVHGVPPDAVHFHEVGGVDAIIDVTATAIGLEYLGIDRLVASPLHLGGGFVQCAHGLYPVPAPATAYLLEGAAVYTSQTRGELVTPTGAAIVSTLAKTFGPMPSMVVEAVGYGAGTREREFPNVLRAFLGRPVDPPAARQVNRTPFPQQHTAPPGPGGYHDGPAVVIEANIDDMNPQWFEHLSERLLAANALDVLLIPVQMKKSRPGVLLHVLAHPDSVDDLLAIIFAESTSIGVRTYPVTKHMLQREHQTVQTPYGPVRVKLSRLGQQVVNILPEYEDCRRLAQEHGIPLKEIYRLVFRLLEQTNDE